MKLACFLLINLMSLTVAVAQNITVINNKKLSRSEQEVWSKVVELHKAVFGTKDSNIISGLTSSHLHYGHSGGNIEDKAVMVTNASNNKTTYQNVSNELVSINIVNNVAMVRLILRAISVEKEMPSPLDLGILQVWAKEGNAWKLYERQAVKLNKQ